MQDSAGVNPGIIVEGPVTGTVNTRVARATADTAAVGLYRAFARDPLTLALNVGARHRRISHDGALRCGTARTHAG